MNSWVVTNTIAAWLIPPGSLVLLAGWGLIRLRRHPRDEGFGTERGDQGRDRHEQAGGDRCGQRHVCDRAASVDAGGARFPFVSEGLTDISG